MNASSMVKTLRERIGKKRRLLEIILIVAVVLGVQWFQTLGLPAGVAPPLAGMRSDGVAVDLATRVGVGGTADGRLTANTATAVKEAQRPVLVVFWSVWCPVCKLEEGNITHVAERWPVLSVAMQSGDAATVSRHLQERDIALPALIDASGKQAMAWQVQGVPTHFIVDASGQIRFRVVGYATTLGLMARLWWAEHVGS
jgi:thiol-disulfide isomerase/thioredoxin